MPKLANSWDKISQMKKNNRLDKILKQYTRGWVSISSDCRKVVASGKTLQGLLERLGRLGNPRGFIMKATGDFSNYVGV